MAFKKVSLTQAELDALQGGDFYKFTEIGQTMLGRLMRSQEGTGQFKKAGKKEYVFKTQNPETKAIEEITINATKALTATLDKFAKPGDKVKIKLVALHDIGLPNKNPEFEVEVDDTPPTAQAAPPPPPKPAAPAASDDIPF
jgi:hypothetical protein